MDFCQHSPMKGAFTEAPLAEAFRAKTDDYTRTAKALLSKLQVVWKELDIPPDHQVQEVQSISHAACKVWSDAVEQVENQRQQLKEKLEAVIEEMYRIQQQLGLKESGTETMSLIGEEVASPRKTLKQLYDEFKLKLEHWRNQKEQRLQQFQQVLGTLAATKEQLGRRLDSMPRSDLSMQQLETFKHELGQLQVEKERRMQNLQDQAEFLRTLCHELGEEHQLMMVQVHSSLRDLKDKEVQQLHADALKQMGADTEEALPKVDLSEVTFQRMASKIQEMQEKKELRASEAKEMLDILTSLWDALGVPSHQPEREYLTGLLTGPASLHAKTLTKGMEEVCRIEVMHRNAIEDLVASKTSALEQLCRATHIPMPDVSPLMAAMGPKGTEHTGGQAADVLSKVARMLREVQVAAEKRQPLVQLINDLEAAVAEARWLREYNADPARFKGKDGHRNLQKSIEAEKASKAIPDMLQQVNMGLKDWQNMEREPFFFDGRNYQSAADSIAAEVEHERLEKQAKLQARAQAKAAGRTAALPASASKAVALPAKKPAAAGSRAVAANAASSIPNRRMTLDTVIPMSARDNGRYGGSAARPAALPSKPSVSSSMELSRLDVQHALAKPVTHEQQSTPHKQAAASGSAASPYSTGGGAACSHNSLAAKLAKIMRSSPSSALSSSAQSRPFMPRPPTPELPAKSPTGIAAPMIQVPGYEPTDTMSPRDKGVKRRLVAWESSPKMTSPGSAPSSTTPNSKAVHDSQPAGQAYPFTSSPAAATASPTAGRAPAASRIPRPNMH